jgi:hypothetical protein
MDKMGQRHAIAKTLVLLYPFVIVFFIIFSVSIVNTAPTFRALAVPVFYGFGFLLFLRARLSVARSGTPISSGPKRMSPGYRLLYLSGYIIMVLSVFLTLGLIISV